jgi:1-acyl-sn-glycerol-3-phosphate acyltransferase
MSSPAAAIPGSLTRNAGFHWLWTATFMAGFGDRLAMLLVLRLAGGGADSEHSNPSLAAGADLFFFLPYMCWGPGAGWLCDRVSRKWLAVVSNGVRALVLLAAVALLPGLGHESGALPTEHRWIAWALMAAIGVAAATFAPCKMSIIPNLVAHDDLQRANAVLVNIGIIGNLVGAIFGGHLVEQSASMAVLLTALAYALSCLLLLPLRLRPSRHALAPDRPAPHTGLKGFLIGLHYCRTHLPARHMVLLATLIWGVTSIYLPSLYSLAVHRFDGGLDTYGTLMACLGLGMMAAGALLGWANARCGVELQLAVGLLGAGVAISIQMAAPWLWAAMLLAVFGGFSAGVVLVAQQTLIQRITPDYMRGRVFGAMEMIAETSKVATSAAVFVMPHANTFIPWLMPAVGVLFLAVGIHALRRFAFRGPVQSGIINFLWRATRLWCESVHRLRVVGRSRIPRSGSVILVANHTAGIDPVLIQAPAQRLIRWVMAVEYRLKALEWFWKHTLPICVERSGRDSRQLRQVLDALKQGYAVGLFPEGGIRRAFRGVESFHPGVTLIAQQSGAPIVPVYIRGTPESEHPLASLILPSRSLVVFGKPFHLPADLDRQQATEHIRSRMNELAAIHGPPA